MQGSILSEAFTQIGITPPNDEHICLYSSGVIDSFDLMQLILEIEIATSQRIDLTKLIENKISIVNLKKIILGDK
jgi:acyl carrier protein